MATMNHLAIEILMSRVCSGKGIAGQRLRSIEPVIASKLGFVPFPGTLNLQMDKIVSFPSSAVCFDLDKFIAGDKPFRFYSADIYGNKVLIARSFSCLDVSDDLLEIISPVNLRCHLGLSDGDTIELALHLSSVADQRITEEKK
jgi:CTP-dependent riboflavin kinase